MKSHYGLLDRRREGRRMARGGEEPEVRGYIFICCGTQRTEKNPKTNLERTGSLVLTYEIKYHAHRKKNHLLSQGFCLFTFSRVSRFDTGRQTNVTPSGGSNTLARTCLLAYVPMAQCLCANYSSSAGSVGRA